MAREASRVDRDSECGKRGELSGRQFGRQDNKGQEFPLKVIDPFTFFATFNRKVRDETRIGILKVIVEKFGLVSPLPTDFDGLPVMNPQKSWFFDFEPARKSMPSTSYGILPSASLENYPRTCLLTYLSDVSKYDTWGLRI